MLGIKKGFTGKHFWSRGYCVSTVGLDEAMIRAYVRNQEELGCSCLYAKGMTTREITATFKEMYDADVSPTLISKITNAVIEQVVEWQSRPLDAVYPIIYLDCIVVKVRQDKQVINKSIYLALGVNMEGQKDLLGMWLSENEGAKFWLGVLTELQNRGVKDILIACVDGLKGFPDAIQAVYPQAQSICSINRPFPRVEKYREVPNSPEQHAVDT